MIQPTAPTATAPSVSAAAILAAQPGEGGEMADFGALLTMQLQVPIPAEEAAPLPAATSPAAIAATAMAATGKILPVSLPEAAMPVQVAIEAQPAEPAPALSGVAVLPAALLKARPAAPIAQAKPSEPTEPSAPAEVEAEVAAKAEADAPSPAFDFAAVPVALPAAALPVEQSQAAPAASNATARPATPANLPPAAAPELQVNLPQTVQPQAVQQQAVQQQANMPASTAQAVQPAAPQLALPPEAAKAERDATVQQVRLIEPVAFQVAPASETIIAAPQAVRDPVPTAPTVATATPTAERPHDFTALVDRLVAAREAMQPQSVTMAVRHAEFGAVQLRFQQDASGLSVAMSSADPDFARAVSAAALPVQAASATDTASFSQQGRGETASGGNTDGFAQSRSGQQAPREERATARANPSPATSRTAAGSDPDSGRSGIFA